MKRFMEQFYGTNPGMTPLECQGAVSQHRFEQELAKSPGPWLYKIYGVDDAERTAPLGELSYDGSATGAEMAWAEQTGGKWWDYKAITTYGPYKSV